MKYEVSKFSIFEHMFHSSTCNDGTHFFHSCEEPRFPSIPFTSSQRVAFEREPPFAK
jgi:hypothetical protein